MKPYQESVRMIREGFVAALADPAQRPLLVAALLDALDLGSGVGGGTGMTEEQAAILAELNLNALRKSQQLPPYNYKPVPEGTLSVSMDHHLGLLHCTAATPVLTLRSDTNYPDWAPEMVFTVVGPNAIDVVSQAGVAVNGQTAKTWRTAGSYAAATFFRTGANAWLRLGQASVVV